VEYLQPNHVFLRHPEDNRLFFTNHPLTEGGRALEREIPPAAAANSRARYRALDDLTREAAQTAEGVKDVMGSHAPPARICQHNGIDGAVMNTDTSLVFVPRERALHISRGRPCEAGYGKLRL
jgi:hypothetical protein